MASSKDYLQFILEQLSDLEEITYRAMMGEYILYYRGKIVGGIYDDRLLVKPIKSAVSYMPEAAYELPYEGAKEKIDSFKLAIDMFSDDFMEEDVAMNCNRIGVEVSVLLTGKPFFSK